ncbi:hypothetical protein NE619_17500 [Anaerovorax odorimutans]|uniref:Uncharacterized protein n=1 Tax=Anaerovorax odorimutans TaxID=109327 RepID=A0ABT1RTI5_9FIRM|nr:hypothetical protein [Anaerovorax odorimutans]MCQ4638527.1 hypothetical protein [Anaerovorax odorimutans]
MYQQLRLRQDLKQEYLRQEKLALRLENRLKQLPQGSLALRRDCYYRILSGKGKVEQIPIPPYAADSRALIRQLKERRYIQKLLPILEKNLKYLEKALKNLQLYDPISVQEILPAAYNDFDFSGLLLSGDLDPAAWASQSYQSNPYFPENLKYQSEGGLLTRSKAESMIATQLERHHLAFRYEPALSLGSHTFYPDFCVLHPVCRRLVYWEHFGMMDHSDYACDTMSKLQIYMDHGYHPGNNLIFTWESGSHPLTFAHINTCIRKYFS